MGTNDHKDFDTSDHRYTECRERNALLRFVERLHIIHRKFNRGVGIGSTKFILNLHYGLYDLYWSESMPVGGAISVDFAAMSRLTRDPR